MLIRKRSLHSVSKGYGKLKFILLFVIGICAIGVDGKTLVEDKQPCRFYPATASCQRIPGSFNINTSTAILVSEGGERNAELLKDEIEKVLGLRLSVKKTRRRFQNLDVILLGNEEGPHMSEEMRYVLSHREAYHLSVKDDYALVASSKSEGQLLGLVALLQLIDPKTRTIPKVETSDWPKMSFRGLRGHLPKNTPEEIENFKRIIRAMAFCRLNQLWVRDLYVRRFPASVRWSSHPEISDARCPAQIRGQGTGRLCRKIQRKAHGEPCRDIRHRMVGLSPVD